MDAVLNLNSAGAGGERLDVQIYTPYITLGQLLKMADIVSSGGEVKGFLEDEQVLVNGQPEQRRGRKLYPGDQITILGKQYEIRAK